MGGPTLRRAVVAASLILATGCGQTSTPLKTAAPIVEALAAKLKPETVETAVVEVTRPLSPPVVEPASVSLAPDDFGRQVVVKLDGSDVTARAKWSVSPEGIVAVDSGYVRPLKAGEAKLVADVDGRRTPISVAVAPAAGRAWNFAEDVVPLFTRAGCNTGGCHGRADGQNGFHLSLFGYDAEGDHIQITRNDGGRRLSAVDPALSLLVQKATGRVPHGGGQRIAPGSPEYGTLIAWIGAGAPLQNEAGKAHGRVKAVRVEPKSLILSGPGKAQLRVIATFADGRERDVTRQAIYKTNNDDAATVDGAGRVELLKRAETDLIVRYGSQVVATRVGTVINPDLTFDFAKLPRTNVIDAELFKRLEALKVPPSPASSDAAFLRRVTLDLVGRQPRPQDVREFIADTDPEKRAKLVDALLADRDFVKFWSIKLGDLLEITSARGEFGNSAPLYQAWVTNQLAENTSWDKVVKTLLTSVGDPATKQGAPVNYALDGLDPKIQAEKTAQRFLGLRLRCAQCHDHPFDIWTQDDYFGLAAVFAKVERGGSMAPGGMMARPVVRINPEGKLVHLRTKQPAEAKLLGGEPVKVKGAEDPRAALVDWMTRADNPYFPRATANWVWGQFFGKGLADPVDDLSKANPPVHPELLDALAKHFVDHKYDLRDLIRTVATSQAYGLSSSPVPGNEKDTRLFSHHLPRPLTAHQMADALAQVTDVINRYKDRASGTRAIEVTDPATASAILETFGRCPRINGCASVATPSLSLRQALLLIGGDVIESKVTNLNGYLANLLDLKPTADEVVENLYLRTLCRPPTDEELSHWSAELKGATDLREAAEDLFWALLNSREFAFNH